MLIIFVFFGVIPEIVMVTHNPKMASYCSRLILLKDGMILEDMRNDGDQEAFYQEILGKMKEL